MKVLNTNQNTPFNLLQRGVVKYLGKFPPPENIKKDRYKAICLWRYGLELQYVAIRKNENNPKLWVVTVASRKKDLEKAIFWGPMTPEQIVDILGDTIKVQENSTTQVLSMLK